MDNRGMVVTWNESRVGMGLGGMKRNYRRRKEERKESRATFMLKVPHGKLLIKGAFLTPCILELGTDGRSENQA